MTQKLLLFLLPRAACSCSPNAVFSHFLRLTAQPAEKPRRGKGIVAMATMKVSETRGSHPVVAPLGRSSSRLWMAVDALTVLVATLAAIMLKLHLGLFAVARAVGFREHGTMAYVVVPPLPRAGGVDPADVR